MTPDAFTRSVSRRTPPAALAPALQALWWVAKDDWERAHNIVIAHDGRDCAWVHAHLHRGEGDLPNARWWYKEDPKAGAEPALLPPSGTRLRASC